MMYRIMQISIRLGCHQLRLRVTLICILYVILSFIQWLLIIKITAKTCRVWLYMFFVLFAFHGQSIGVVNNVITKWHQSRDLKHCVVPTCTPHKTIVTNNSFHRTQTLLFHCSTVYTVEPWYNNGSRDRPNAFAFTRFSIKVFFHIFYFFCNKEYSSFCPGLAI